MTGWLNRRVYKLGITRFREKHGQTSYTRERGRGGDERETAKMIRVYNLLYICQGILPSDSLANPLYIQRGTAEKFAHINNSCDRRGRPTKDGHNKTFALPI